MTSNFYILSLNIYSKVYDSAEVLLQQTKNVNIQNYNF